MLFMSDEGTEQGGLIWGAEQLPHGTIEKHGHLSLDQYEENQIFALDAGRKARTSSRGSAFRIRETIPSGKAES
jgi:hypothetical protein